MTPQPFGSPGTIGKQADVYYSVFCAHCNEEYTRSADNKRAFVKQIRSMGWRLIHGQWCCSECGRARG